MEQSNESNTYFLNSIIKDSLTNPDHLMIHYIKYIKYIKPNIDKDELMNIVIEAFDEILAESELNRVNELTYLLFDCFKDSLTNPDENLHP